MQEKSPINGGLDRTVEKASLAAHEQIDRASGAARPAVDRLAGRAHNAVDQASGAAERAADLIEEKGAELMAAQEEMLAQVKSYVREHPLQSIGFAVAGGYLLSRIFGSR